MVVPKRRRRSRRIRGAFVNNIDQEIIDNDVDKCVLLNHLGQIGAKDALANEIHETFNHEEDEASMPSPAGSDMSLSDLGSDEDMHDYACAETSDNEEPEGVSPDGIVNVLSLDIARIMRSYAQDNIKGISRVNGCISITPFCKTYNEINCSISFCKDVETFRHEMDQAIHVNIKTADFIILLRTTEI